MVHLDISNNKHPYTQSSSNYHIDMVTLICLCEFACKPAGFPSGAISVLEHDNESLPRHTHNRQHMFGDREPRSSEHLQTEIPRLNPRFFSLCVRLKSAKKVNYRCRDFVTFMSRLRSSYARTVHTHTPATHSPLHIPIHMRKFLLLQTQQTSKRTKPNN